MNTMVRRQTVTIEDRESEILFNVLDAIRNPGFSLTSIAGTLNVAPVVVASSNAAVVPFYGKALKAVLDIYSGYFVQVFAVLSNSRNIQAIRLIRALNPDMLSFKEDLSRFNFTNIATESRVDPYFAKEAMGFDDSDSSKSPRNEYNKVTEGKPSDMNFRKSFEVVLNLGDKPVSADDKDGKGGSVSIPVTASVYPTIVDSNSVVNMLGADLDFFDVAERFHMWRSGRISLANLLIGNDIINKKKKIMVDDKSGVFSAMMKRTSNKLFGSILDIVLKAASNDQFQKTLPTDVISAYKAGATSNIFIITDEEAKEIEYESKSKLSDYNTRQLIMDKTYSFMLVVLNTEWNRVTFYYRDIRESQSVPIKMMGKDGDSDKIMEIFKAFNGGNAPSF